MPNTVVVDDYSITKQNKSLYYVVSPKGVSYEVKLSGSGELSCNHPLLTFGGGSSKSCKHISMVKKAFPDVIPVRHPRATIDTVLDVILPKVRPCCSKLEVVGSYRRGKPDSKDIDILAIGDPACVLKVLTSEGEKPVMSGSSIIRVHYGEILVDISFVPSVSEWGSSLLYRTGCFVPEKNFIICNGGLIRGDRLPSKGAYLIDDRWVVGNLVDSGIKEELEVVFDDGRIFSGSSEQKFKVLEENEFVWKEVVDLREGDFIEEQELSFEGSYQHYKAFKIDEDLAACLGWFIGDGCASRKDWYFNLREDDEKNFCKVVLNKISKVSERFKNPSLDRQGVNVLHLHSRTGGRDNDLYFDKIEVMLKILESPISVRKAFVKWLWGADGSYKGEVPVFCNTTELVVKYLQMILISLGIKPKLLKINKERLPKNYKDRYELRIRMRDSLRFIKEIGVVPSKIMDAKHLERVASKERLGKPKWLIVEAGKMLRSSSEWRSFTMREKAFVCKVEGGDGSYRKVRELFVRCGLDDSAIYNLLGKNYCRVVKVYKTGNKVLMKDISIMDNVHAYVVNGLVTHNSASFNVGMRGWCKGHGFKLNEHGLFDASGARLAGDTEASIFKVLGLVFVPPEARDDFAHEKSAMEVVDESLIIDNLGKSYALSIFREDIPFEAGWNDIVSSPSSPYLSMSVLKDKTKFYFDMLVRNAVSDDGLESTIVKDESPCVASPQKTSVENGPGALETLKHKAFVTKFIGKVVTELKLRAVHHDDSKLLSPEVEAFEEVAGKLKDLEYGSKEYKENLDKIRPAIDHHQHSNRHHPEYHKNGICDMTLIDLLEMLCDWQAAILRHENKKGNLFKSIEVNQKRFGFSDELASILRASAKELLSLLDPKDKEATRLHHEYFIFPDGKVVEIGVTHFKYILEHEKELRPYLGDVDLEDTDAPIDALKALFKNGFVRIYVYVDRLAFEGSEKEDPSFFKKIDRFISEHGKEFNRIEINWGIISYQDWVDANGSSKKALNELRRIKGGSVGVCSICGKSDKVGYSGRCIECQEKLELSLKQNPIMTSEEAIVKIKDKTAIIDSKLLSQAIGDSAIYRIGIPDVYDKGVDGAIAEIVSQYESSNYISKIPFIIERVVKSLRDTCAPREYDGSYLPLSMSSTDKYHIKRFIGYVLNRYKQLKSGVNETSLAGKSISAVLSSVAGTPVFKVVCSWEQGLVHNLSRDMFINFMVRIGVDKDAVLHLLGSNAICGERNFMLDAGEKAISLREVVDGQRQDLVRLSLLQDNSIEVVDVRGSKNLARIGLEDYLRTAFLLPESDVSAIISSIATSGKAVVFAKKAEMCGLKSVPQVKSASVIDYPMSTLDPDVWDLDPSGYPLLRKDVKSLLLQKVFEGGLLPEEVQSILIEGSLGTYQYLPNTDLDLHVFVPLLMPEERYKFLYSHYKEDLSWWKLPGSEHEVEISLLRETQQRGDATYDVMQDLWIDYPPFIPKDYDPKLKFPDVWQTAVMWMSYFENQLGKLSRDLKDLERLSMYIKTLTSEESSWLESLLKEKLSLCDTDLKSLSLSFREIVELRHRGYESDWSPANAEDLYMKSKSWTPSNIQYKFLERYGYVSVLYILAKLNGVDLPVLDKVLKAKEILDQYRITWIPEHNQIRKVVV